LSEVQTHTLAHLRAVDSVLRVTFPIEVENGKYEVIEGNRSGDLFVMTW
jgi:glutamate dehydrogenase (NAD(P)+)